MAQQLINNGESGKTVRDKLNANFTELYSGSGSGVGLRVYNVKDYGAVHDGSTDDTAAIQSAINACFAAGGGVVYFPNGIYAIKGALVTSLNGVNPNCQIYIPQTDDTASSFPTIKFLGESAYNLGLNTQTNNAGVILKSTITGSGSYPAVFGTKGRNTSYLNFNFTNVWFENIAVTVYTNNGTAAASVTPFYMRWVGTSCFRNCLAVTDVPLASTTSPVGVEVAGYVVGNLSDNGPNVMEACGATGFKYGYVIGEHTTFNNVYAIGNYYGFTFVGGNFGAYGVILGHRNNTSLNFSNAGIMGSLTSASKVMVDLTIDYEIDVFGKWNDTQYFLVDNTNMGYGSIKYNGFSGPFNNLRSSTVGGINMYISPVWSMPLQINQAGGPTTAGGVGTNTAIYEVNSGTAAAPYDYDAAFQAVTSQSNTSTAAIGRFQAINTAIGGAEKRSMILAAYTNGAINTSILYLYNLIAGALQEVFHVDKGFNISIPVVLPQYANDAAADAASQGGTAPKGTMYYNTTTDKVKVKENLTWKTVTTA